MENIILMHGEALLWILGSFKCSFEFSNIQGLDMFYVRVVERNFFFGL